MHDVLARLDCSIGHDMGMVGRHAIVQASFGNDADEQVRIKMGRVSIRRQLISRCSHNRPGTRTKVALALHVRESILQACIADPDGREHLLGKSAAQRR